MWSFPGIYANRGSGTEQASSDVEQGTGVDLRCGGGHLGLQGAPGALPRALGFDSHLDIKTKAALTDGFCFWSRVRESNPPSQLGKLE